MRISTFSPIEMNWWVKSPAEEEKKAALNFALTKAFGSGARLGKNHIIMVKKQPRLVFFRVR
jgi:hypothetical protein